MRFIEEGTPVFESCEWEKGVGGFLIHRFRPDTESGLIGEHGIERRWFFQHKQRAPRSEGRADQAGQISGSWGRSPTWRFGPSPEGPRPRREAKSGQLHQPADEMLPGIRALGFCRNCAIGITLPGRDRFDGTGGGGICALDVTIMGHETGGATVRSLCEKCQKNGRFSKDLFKNGGLTLDQLRLLCSQGKMTDR